MKRLLLSVLFAIILVTAWFYDIFHKSVEPVLKLMARDIEYAIDAYFGKEPDDSTSFSINQNLNEFQGSVLAFRDALKDSTIRQYTWIYSNYKVTIWTAHTAKHDGEIIDAIRYKNSVRF